MKNTRKFRKSFILKQEAALVDDFSKRSPESNQEEEEERFLATLIVLDACNC